MANAYTLTLAYNTASVDSAAFIDDALAASSLFHFEMHSFPDALFLVCIVDSWLSLRPETGLINSLEPYLYALSSFAP